jgi:hypothetical protein
MRRIRQVRDLDSMRTRRIGAALLAALGALALVLLPTTPSQAESEVCYGTVGCAAGAVTSACTADESLVEEVDVPQLGTLYLYQSASCATAWADLAYAPNTAIGSDINGYEYIAEIFYEPPQGGPEQFQITTPWLGGSSETQFVTSMVPNSASFKACAGSPNGSGDAFDEEPLGLGGVSEPATDGWYNTGACTVWH